MKDCVLFTRTGPANSNGVGIISGDFNICGPEEGRFNVWNQSFTRQRCFILFFSTLNLTTRGRTPLSLGSYALYQGLMAFLSILTEARDFHCYSHVFENLGNWTIPSDHAAARLVIQKANQSGTTGQTHSKLDVRTSRFFAPSLLPHAHACQATCLARHMPAVPPPKFQLTKAQNQMSAVSQ